MQIAMATVAERVEEHPGGRRDLIGPWWQVRVDAFPTAIPAHALIVRLLIEPGDRGVAGPLQIRLVSPSGEAIMVADTPIDVATAGMFMSCQDVIATVQAGAVVLATPGVYVWELRDDDSLVARVPFSAIRRERASVN